jgi:hypothetical protein
MKILLILSGTLFVASCVNHRAELPFRVVPAQPNYLLRSPELKDTPFPDVLGQYTGLGSGWVDLKPKMNLLIENAYYREGAPKHGLNGFLGTEVARYRVQRGLQLFAVESKLEKRPAGQPAVQELISRAQARYHAHRFFYQLVFKAKGEARGAVLLGARSTEELNDLSDRLIADPEYVCASHQSIHCTIFPEVCTVSLEIEITVNGVTRTVLWGSILSSVVNRPQQLKLSRLYQGHLAPVNIDSRDPNALRLPLVPGDRVDWN